MKKSLIITLAVSFFIIVLIAILLRKPEKEDDEIEVKSNLISNYIPTIPKKEKPKEPPKPPIIPKEEKSKEPKNPVAPIIYEKPKIDYEKISSIKRSREGLVIKTIMPETKTNEKTRSNKLHYTSEFKGLEKDEAQDPVKLDLVITADRFIPVILKTAISSNLPGNIIAVTEDNIYSSHGSNLLIPKGSSVFGRYESLQKNGDSRLEIIWTRILTPRGVNINLTNSNAVDEQGKSGAGGLVDNHIFEKYGIALTLSTLTSAMTYLALKHSKTSNTPEAQLNNNLIANYKNDIASIISEVLQENINLAPIINLHIGQRLLIQNNVDLWFNKLDEKNIEVLYLKNKSQIKD